MLAVVCAVLCPVSLLLACSSPPCRTTRSTLPCSVRPFLFSALILPSVRFHVDSAAAGFVGFFRFSVLVLFHLSTSLIRLRVTFVSDVSAIAVVFCPMAAAAATALKQLTGRSLRFSCRNFGSNLAVPRGCVSCCSWGCSSAVKLLLSSDSVCCQWSFAHCVVLNLQITKRRRVGYGRCAQHRARSCVKGVRLCLCSCLGCLSSLLN